MNQPILSQDEVDALLQGIGGEGTKAEPEAGGGAGGGQASASAHERQLRGRMPALELVNERFARHLKAGMARFIQRQPEVSVGAVKAQKFSAYLRELVVPTNFNIVTMQPLRGQGLVICEPSLVFAVIDALFGGAGKFHTRIEGREFSATELRVITRLVETILAGYRQAWAAVYPLELVYQRSEMQPQFAQVAAPNELVLATAFTVEFGEVSGTVQICLPYAGLEPIREQLYATQQPEGPAPDRRWLESLGQQLQAAQVELVAELARAPATVEQLLSFKAGDFIELDLDPRVQAKVDGVPVLECHYGTSNGRYALKVERLLMSATAQNTPTPPITGPRLEHAHG